jgi:hypothetical protein
MLPPAALLKGYAYREPGWEAVAPAAGVGIPYGVGVGLDRFVVEMFLCLSCGFRRSGGLEPTAPYLPTKHRDLVAQHQKFDILGPVLARATAPHGCAADDRDRRLNEQRGGTCVEVNASLRGWSRVPA